MARRRDREAEPIQVPPPEPKREIHATPTPAVRVYPSITQDEIRREYFKQGFRL
jgi:hypothetical protein